MKFTKDKKLRNTKDKIFMFIQKKNKQRTKD